MPRGVRNGIKVLFINNDGGGFADFITVKAGTTIGELFVEKFDDASPADYRINVNRMPVAQDYTLKADDRITITPTNVQGAR